MIIYNSKHWFRAFMNFHQSYVLRVLLRYVVWIGLYTTAVTCVVIEVFQADVRFASGIFSLLGIVLSIILVYRTNTANDRWWEGRKQWGSLVNTSRDLSMQLHTVLPKADAANRAFFAKHIANFAIALTEHLRNGVKIDDLVHLDEVDRLSYPQRQHLPNFIAAQIYERVNELYQQKIITDAHYINLKPNISTMLNVLGACERIKKTPIPFSYSFYIKNYVLIYSLLLPFGLINEFGYYTIPMVMLLFYAFAGIELMAEEIEDPFGLDCNDLPTGSIAQTIKNNTYEIFCLFGEVNQPKAEAFYEKIS